MSNNRFSQSLAALTTDESPAPVQPTIPEKQLLSGVIAKMPPKKSRGLARTYYLSKEVANAVEREAKRRGIIKSNLVDEILKRVLLEAGP